jgi:DNA-binding MarR family transcriptional regulator
MANINDWQLLATFSQIFRTVSDSFTDQIDMHRGQSMMLCTVREREGMTQSEIAEQLSIQGATVSNMLQKMEEAGLVIRQRDTDDNRLVRVYLTETGRQKEAAIHEQFGAMQDEIFKGVSEADRCRFREMLQQVIVNLSGLR